jgi:hypothetical protein
MRAGWFQADSRRAAPECKEGLIFNEVVAILLPDGLWLQQGLPFSTARKAAAPPNLKCAGRSAHTSIMCVQQLRRGPASGPDNQMSFRTANHHDQYW